MGLLPTLQAPVTESRNLYAPVRLNYSEQLYGGGWRLNASIRYDRRFRLPPEPAASQEWQIGFIQNVMGVSCICRYESGRVVRINDRNQWLDALRPGNQSWYAPSRVPGQSIRAYASINYGGGQMSLVGAPQVTSAELSMQDYPHTQYFNFFRGGPSGDQLREVEDNIRFRVWLAAKTAASPGQVASSYHIIAFTNVFMLTYRLNIAGVNEDFAQQVYGAVAAGGSGSRITRPAPQCYISTVNWMQANSNTHRPVVSGRTANEALGDLQSRHGVGPLTRWGE